MYNLDSLKGYIEDDKIHFIWMDDSSSQRASWEDVREKNKPLLWCSDTNDDDISFSFC